MKKAILTLALGLLASGAAAQQGLTCGNTGFNMNIGSTAKSFRCAPVPITVGSGTLTFNATSTVTGTAGAFASLAAPTAVPGSDGLFFQPAGLYAFVGGQTYFLNITAKASSVSITALLGGVAVSFSGTATRWGFWNTTCLRTAASQTSQIADPLTTLDARTWASPVAIRQAITAAFGPEGITISAFQYFQATGSAVAMSYFSRPQGIATSFQIGADPIVNHSFGSPGSSVALTLVEYIMGGSTTHLRGREFQMSHQSSAADTFTTACFYSSK
jgi:hypothetical protein